MPAHLTARAMLWIGIALLAVSVLSQAALDFIFRSAGSAFLDGMQVSWWYPLYQFVPTVLIPLGTLFLAAFFVANAIERRAALAPASGRRPAITAAWLFWTGLVLTVLGLLVGASLEEWLTGLNAQGRTSIALDALNLVVVPLRMVLVPLGVALLPASVLVKKVQALGIVDVPSEPLVH
jgi:hypothetical protein